jgi:hypothetical protein
MVSVMARAPVPVPVLERARVLERAQALAWVLAPGWARASVPPQATKRLDRRPRNRGGLPRRWPPQREIYEAS